MVKPLLQMKGILMDDLTVPITKRLLEEFICQMKLQTAGFMETDDLLETLDQLKLMLDVTKGPIEPRTSENCVVSIQPAGFLLNWQEENEIVLVPIISSSCDDSGLA